MTPDDLYALPPEEFVAARDALARSLPKDEAAAVRALRRPTVVAAAINAAVRRSPALVATLEAASVDEELAEALRAGRLVREAQAGGFGPVPERIAPRPVPEPAVDPRELEQAQAELTAAEAEVTRLRRELAEASERARSARVAVRKAELAAERLRHEAWLRADRDR